MGGGCHVWVEGAMCGWRVGGAICGEFLGAVICVEGAMCGWRVGGAICGGVPRGSNLCGGVGIKAEGSPIKILVSATTVS